MVHIIPYEVIEKLFGTFVADNFNTISLSLTIVGLFAAVLLGKKFSFRVNSRPPEYDDQEYQEPEPEEDPVYESRQGKWSPAGWVFNEENQKWEPPDYLAKESREKWVWDVKKQIWVDQEKEARLERYRAYRKSQGKGPTYEEWKAAKLKEQHPE